MGIVESYFYKPKEVFLEQYQIIKESINALIDTLSLFESHINKPGNYWEPNTLAWNIGIDLFSREPEWLYENYRVFINEILSGNPYGDYSQYLQMNENEVANLPFILSYQTYIADIPEKYHIQEPTMPGSRQWGVSFQGKQISGDTTRFQRYIANLYKIGVFSNLETKIKRKENVYIVEIGAGFGMLADYIYSILKNRVKYIIIDIPPTLALAATYFAITKPNLKQVIFDPRSTTGFILSEEIKKNDIIFLPHYAANCLLDLPQIDMAINTFSFQEMAEDNINYYAEIIAKKLRGILYSDNFRRHPHNYSLKSKVCDILKKYFYLFPNDETNYEILERSRSYMWQSYLHIGTSKLRPTFLSPSTELSDYLWGDSFKLDIKKSTCL